MKPIPSCLRCGSRDLHMLTLADGLAAEGGELLRWVCSRCNWQGTPIEFPSEAARLKFEKAIASSA